MQLGNFYFLKNEYFVDFPDGMLMQNKEIVNGEKHNRPCFFAFCDANTGIYWMVPISSRVAKYREIYRGKLARYRTCDTIVFGNLLGQEKAFLIQNMCPVTEDYIESQYVDNTTFAPVKIDGMLEREVISKAMKVLSLERKGVHLVFPSILKIERILLQRREV